MSEKLIREKIAAMVASVPGTGVVHSRARGAANAEQFLLLFQDPDTKTILGFEVCRESDSEVYDTADDSTQTHSFVIRGYKGLNDENNTYDAFQTLVEAVKDRFRFDHDLSGLQAEIGLVGALQVRVINEKVFGSILCHCAELVISVSEMKTKT